MEFIDLHAQYLQLRDEINANIQKVLDHGKYIMGPEVFELEDQLADYVGVQHCITCANGTDALQMVLMAWNIKAVSKRAVFDLLILLRADRNHNLC